MPRSRNVRVSGAAHRRQAGAVIACTPGLSHAETWRREGDRGWRRPTAYLGFCSQVVDCSPAPRLHVIPIFLAKALFDSRVATSTRHAFPRPLWVGAGGGVSRRQARMTPAARSASRFSGALRRATPSPFPPLTRGGGVD